MGRSSTKHFSIGIALVLTSVLSYGQTWNLYVGGPYKDIPSNNGNSNSTNTGACPATFNDIEIDASDCWQQVKLGWPTTGSKTLTAVYHQYQADFARFTPTTQGTFHLSTSGTQWVIDPDCTPNANPLGASPVQIVNVFPDLSATGFPAAICNTATALNLYSYVNRPSGVTFQEGAIPIGSSFDPASFPIGNHTITATFPFDNGNRTVTLGTISINQIAATTNPSATAICVGGNASFSITGTGTAISYQWQESINGGSTWSDIANSGTYTILNGSLTLSTLSTTYNNYQYRCKVSNSCNVAISNPATLTVYGQVGLSSTFAASGNYCPDGTVSLSVSGTPQNGAINYRWQTSTDNATWNDWANGTTSGSGTVSGFSTSSLTVALSGYGWNNLYLRCRVYDNCGSTTQNVTGSHKIQIYNQLTITTQPSDQAACQNGSASFGATSVAQNGSLTYQWQQSTDGGSSYSNLSNGTLSNETVSGASTATLSLTNLALGASGYKYHCVINDGCGTSTRATSNVGTLTVYGQVPITSQPVNTSACQGSSASFSVSGTAQNGTLGYQWQYSTDGGGSWNNVTTGTGYTSANYSKTVSLSDNTTKYRCILSDGCGTISQNISSAVSLTVFGQVPITTQPANSVICPGTGTTFTIGATAQTGTLTYKWEVNSDGTGSTWSTVTNGGIYSNATTATLTLTGVSTAFSGYRYRATVTDGCGIVNQNISNGTATLTFNVPAFITTHPVNENLCPGVGLSLSVVAGGTPAPTYQWTKNGTDISGATLSTFSVVSVTASDAATYAVKVANLCNTVTSNNSVVVVYTSGPTITTQPSSQSLCPGNPASFSVSISGTGPMSYQWKKNGVAITGATSNSYSISSVVVSDGGNYTVDISNTCSIATSNVAALTVYSPVSISSQPAAFVACPSGAASFTVTATGSGTLTYQWKKSGAAIPGATSSSFSIPSVSAGDVANYTVDVTGTCGTLTSNTAGLSISSSITISSQPVNSVICVNSGATFSVSATGPSLTYRWKLSTDGGTTYNNINDGGIYSGATTATLTITTLGASSSGNHYEVFITSSCSNTTSTAATVTVVVPPTVATDPTNQVACLGSAATFTAAAGGTSPTYQWQFNSTGTWGNITGAVSASYPIAVVANTNAGSYRVIISNTCGSNTSATASLTVNALTSISTQPTDQAVCPGGTVGLSVVAGGTGSFSYAWQKDSGSGYVSYGTNSSSISITNAAISDATNYKVTVTGACGPDVVSNVAKLTVNVTPTKPVVPDVSRCGDGSLSTTATSTSPGPTFNWYANSADITSIYNGATYQVSNLTVTTSYYTSVVSLGCESGKQQVTYTHNAPTSVALGGDKTLCVGQGLYDLSADITSANAAGGVFTWSANNTNYSGNNFNPTLGNGVYVITYTPSSTAQATPNCYLVSTRNLTVVSSGGTGGITFDSNVVGTGNNLNTCVGDNPITLSDLPSVKGGTWSTVQGSGITTSGVATVFTPDASSYTAVNPNIFRYTTTIGGCTATVDLNIYVKDNQGRPTVTGLPNSVCPGTQLTLTGSVSAPGSYSYRWYKSGDSTAFATTSSISYTVSTDELLQVRTLNSPFGCLSASTDASIVTPFAGGQITVNTSVINASDYVAFSYTVTKSGNSYMWDFGDGFHSVEQNPNHPYYAPGTYDIGLVVTSNLGCSQTYSYNSISVNGTPINIVTGLTEQFEGFRVYPVPAENSLNIESSTPLHNVILYDLNGKVIVSLSADQRTSFIIDISGLSQGVYVLTMAADKNVQRVKIIKK